MLEILFDSQGTVHHEFISQDPTVNKEMNVDTIHCLHDTKYNILVSCIILIQIPENCYGV